MPDRFGFEVVYHPAEDWEGGDPAGWTVSLPHQCDAWHIVGDKYEPPVSHEQAMADLNEFIVEAFAARDRLAKRSTDA